MLNSLWVKVRTYTHLLGFQHTEYFQTIPVKVQNKAWGSRRVSSQEGIIKSPSHTETLLYLRNVHTELSSSGMKLQQCVNPYSRRVLQIENRFVGTHHEVEISVGLFFFFSFVYPGVHLLI